MKDQLHAQRNIVLFPILKIFTKRVFLPLSAIYFIQEANFSFTDIGILGSFYYAVNFLSDIPTGIFADRFGRAMSLRIGALLNILATLIYVFIPHKPAIFVGTLFEAIGYGFLLGAGEALIHDSLIAIHKASSYTKVVSRAQSLALIINAVLLALVPMTYSIDHRLPFLIGTMAYASLGITALFLKDVHAHRAQKPSFRSLGLIFRSRGALGFAIGFGIMGALYTAPTDFINLAFKQLGVAPALLGWIFSAGSLAGAVVGTIFHKVKVLPLWLVLIGDGFFACIMYIVVYIYSLPLLILAFIACMSIWRYRRIIYQEKLLTKFPNQPKATLLSIMSNLEGLQQMWLPFATGMIVGAFGLRNGLGLIGLASIVVVLLFIYFGKTFLTEHTLDDPKLAT